MMMMKMMKIVVVLASCLIIVEYKLNFEIEFVFGTTQNEKNSNFYLLLWQCNTYNLFKEIIYIQMKFMLIFKKKKKEQNKVASNRNQKL